MLQYVVKRQYEDFVIQSYETNGNLEVFAVSDMPTATTATVTVSMLYLSGSVCPANSSAARGANTGPVAWSATSQQIQVPANNAALVLSIKVADILKLAPDCTPNTCYIHVEGEAVAVGHAAKAVDGGKLKGRSDSFLVEFKHLDLQKPHITLSGFEQVSVFLATGPCAHMRAYKLVKDWPV